MTSMTDVQPSQGTFFFYFFSNYEKIISLLDKGYKLLFDNNKPEESIQYYDQVLAINLNNIEALNSKGYSLFILG